MAHRVEREWLRRIPNGSPGLPGDPATPGHTEQTVRRQVPPGEGEPGGSGGSGDAAAEAEQGEDEERDAFSPAGNDAGPEAVDADSDVPPQGEPGASEGADAAAEKANRPQPDLDTALKVPDEVEQRRREEEQREREQQRQGALNRHLAQQAFSLQGHYLRNLAARFARMVSKVAEDSADLPEQGDDEWDRVELIRRRFTGRLLNQCRMTRERRKVAVVLDTSPSCAHQARLFASVARVAEDLGDCELYDAPNFAIHAQRLSDTWETLPDPEREWNFQGRVVIAFGDFDGLERICAASARRGNKIYWFCCEERPTVLESQRERFVKGYKGHYMPTTTLGQLMQAMRRVR